MASLSTDNGELSPIREGMPPLMGFAEEQYIPAHSTGGGWAAFYTCIANGKRVYVWGYADSSLRDGTCCVMVSDHVYDPARKAGVAELQHMFARQHEDQRVRGISRTHHAPVDPFTLQAFIHHVTLGGNERTIWARRGYT